MSKQPQYHRQAEALVDDIINTLGHDIRIGLPLGLGKPVQLVNALYQRAKADPKVQLTILTALSLDKPQPSNALEASFLNPFLDRVFADCPRLDYMVDRLAGRVPQNVRVLEFFFKPGSELKNPRAQQDYISSNYTHAARDVFQQGCNVAAQLVAKREDQNGVRFSLSCNPDTGPELLDLLRSSGRRHLVIAQVHADLPYMVHDAEVPESTFDHVLEAPELNTRLFSTPKQPVAPADHAIGLHVSSLIKDGGTLQIGIGAMGDAIVHALCLRQQSNALYQQLIEAAPHAECQAPLVEQFGGKKPFRKGVYGATEMFVDGFLDLYDAGILSRRVYDDEHLQTLINRGEVDPNDLQPEVLDELEALGERVIRGHEFEVLQRHGLFVDDCRYELGHIIAPDGERIMANLAIPESRAALKAKCLGKRLRNGVVLHGGFFLGPNNMYARLNAMSEEERALFAMQGVYKINQLDHAPDLYKAQRIDARFVNSGLMATLQGAVVSDGLADGRVVSGVGGQYNFVAMAHHLLSGRSILMVRSHRGEGEQAQSNILAEYGHCTIPRHLRDIVVTEYGIADLRSQTDAECVKRMLRISDARFQDELLAKARQAGKIEAEFQIPDQWRRNTPENLAAWLKPGQQANYLGRFPLGTELSKEEIELGAALKTVKARAESMPRWSLLLRGLRSTPANTPLARWAMERMQLERPQGLQQRVVRSLLLEALSQSD
nr:hypothetical protein [Oceanococcus sp. HetDA_MAG_MS8]